MEHLIVPVAVLFLRADAGHLQHCWEFELAEGRRRFRRGTGGQTGVALS
jgi:hypothetical protein